MGLNKSENFDHRSFALSQDIPLDQLQRALESHPNTNPLQAFRIRREARKSFMHKDGRLVPLARIAIVHPTNFDDQMLGLSQYDWQVNDVECSAEIVPSHFHATPEEQAQQINDLQKQNYDGVIIFHSSMPKKDAVTFQTRFPLIYIDPLHEIPEGPNREILAPDYTTGMTQAVHSLRKGGHRRIVFISDAASETEATRKEAAYLSTIDGLGLKRTDIIWDALGSHNESMYKKGYDLTKYALTSKTRRPPTAVIAANLQLTVGAIRAIFDSKMEVPRDISVIGIGDYHTARFLAPRADIIAPSTANVPIRLASKRILENISGEPVLADVYDSWDDRTHLLSAGDALVKQANPNSG